MLIGTGTVTALFESYAQHLARVGDLPMRAGILDGRWRLAICDRGWRIVDESIAVFDDVSRSSELTRLRSWIAEVLGVRLVELIPDTRTPGAYVVSVEE